jgi:ATP/maltotriose-dependent transcriptional regulator MalT
MAEYNADFWEIATDSRYLESVPANRALWFETEEDRSRRHAFQDFFQEVKPVVAGIINSELTNRQKEVVTLYYFQGKTQEDIAAILDLSQSTVSRHLFGTVRDGKKVGGALSKLRKVIERKAPREVDDAFDHLNSRLAEAV